MRLIFADEFDNATIDTPPLERQDGNGILSEAGGLLRMTMPDTEDCRWSSGIYNAPILWTKESVGYRRHEEQVVRDEIAGGGLFMAETKIAAVSLTPDDGPKAGITFFAWDAYCWKLSVQWSDNTIVWQKIVNGTQTSVITGVSIVDPNINPTLLRLYYCNQTSDPDYVYDPHGRAINNGNVAAYYSDDNGATWTFVAEQTDEMDGNQCGFGLWAKRSAETVSTTAWADFEYLRIYSIEPHEFTALPGPTRDTADLETASWEDQADFPTQQGPLRNQFPNVGIGYLLPGDPAQSVELTRLWADPGSWEDDWEIQSTSGFESYLYPNVPQGVALPGDPAQDLVTRRKGNEPASWEDNCLVLLDPTLTYRDGLNDADGKETINGWQYDEVLVYDATADDWDSTPAGFHGIGRDGRWYYDGQQCAVGPFCSLANGENYNAWCYSVDPMPGNSNSVVGSWIRSVIADDTIRLQSVALINGWLSDGPCSFGKWTIGTDGGDFDIEFSWANLSVSGTTGGMHIDLWRDGNNRLFLRREVGNHIDCNHAIDGAWQSESQITSSATSGKFRLVRTGSNVQPYYDIGGGWVALGSARAMGTWGFYIRILCGGDGNFSGDVELSGFTVNSGVASNESGWRREASGTDRGELDPFPEKAVIVGGRSSINIIDADTDLLWMRYNFGQYNAYFRYSSDDGRKVRQIAMHDGVMYCAIGNGSTSGELLRFDYNLDECRIAFGGTGRAGAYYETYADYGSWGQFISIGHMRRRNSGNHYKDVSFNNWQLAGSDCFAVAVTHETGYEYLAVGHNNGVDVKKFRRWYRQASDKIEAPLWSKGGNSALYNYWVHFDAGLTLYWADTEKVYSANQSTYQAAWGGGTFVRDEEQTLQGTRPYWQQHRCVLHNGYIFTAANEGVYRVQWPSGSWDHFYGRPGSGATHEVLPLNTHVVMAIRFKDDGGTPLLACIVENLTEAFAQVVFINLSTNTVYAKSKMFPGRTGSFKAVGA